MSERTLYEKVETIHGHKYIRLGSGRLITFWNTLDAAERTHTTFVRHFSRAFKLADGEYDLEAIEWRLDKFETYIGAVRKHLEELRGKQSKRDRIALLRNTTGRTPEEAAAYLAKADQLEKELS